ncbi:hypothetical protein [uncultured Eubacterium sp.]|uniref:hypothetical protein n=1 Tax=uncultured Eubacterium sp. TaxID=165185 RepID=UPI0025E2D836|nr:hypothetical protein [uncultured Eubacterium sp.]
MGLITIILSCLYLGFVPPRDFDLYRHFELFNTIKKMSFKELFFSDYKGNSAQMADYIDSAKGYLFYLFAISRLKIKELLPVVTGIITYGLLFNRIKNIARDFVMPNYCMALGISIVLIFIDFRDISCIRNILAYVIFAFAIYQDLVKKKRQVFCFIIYILLCTFHMACLILLAIRLLLLLSNKYLKGLATILLIGIFPMGEVIMNFVGKFSGSAYLSRLAYKIHVYRFGRTEYNWHGAIMFFLILAVFFVGFLYVQKNIREIRIKNYSTFCIYVIAFTLGASSQYDILLRNIELIVILLLPHMMLFVQKFVDFKNGHLLIKCNSLGGNVYFIVFMICSLATLVFYSWIAYIPMNQYFMIKG